MSSNFYKSIIEDEMKTFGIKKESLKNAAKSVGTTYSRKALNKGQTFLDYNIPSNRCAYLYKYASIHTGLVTKYFNKLIEKKVVKSSLMKQEVLKICCLGGGPGTDIVGLFKVLALNPSYHEKVVEVTILDICGGWRNSFKRIMSSLIGGKVKDVPDTFINVKNFKFKLVEVDLLFNLPSNVATILSEADVICMVKFVSAILGSSTSVSALEVIGRKLKPGSIVLFIDNFQGNVFKPLAAISGQIGLQLVLGPLHESFNNKTGYIKSSVTSSEKQMFGCLPLFATRVTVLGFIKSMSLGSIPSTLSVSLPLRVLDDDDDDDSWDTDDDDIDSSVKPTFELLVKHNPKKHKFTQTSENICHDPNASYLESVPVNELSNFVDKLCDLVNVLINFHQKTKVENHCCHCGS